MPLEKPRLSTDEASAHLLSAHGLKVAAGTLARWRVEGGSPPYQTLNRRVLYPRAELDAWAEAKLGAVVANTAEAYARRRAEAR